MTTATIEKTETDKLELLSDVDYKKAQGVSQAEYAKHRGVSRQAIHKLIKSGHIEVNENGMIDVENTDIVLEMKLDPSFGNSNPVNGSTDPFGLDLRAGKKDCDFFQAKAIKETFNAKLAELTYRERLGELVNRKKTLNIYYRKVQAVVGKLQKVADRISPDVAMESDRLKCHTIINNEIRACVEDFGING